MSDMLGLYELTVFSEVLGQARQVLDAGQPLLVTVDCRLEEDSIRLTAQKIEALDGAVSHAAAGLRVFLGQAAAVKSLRGIIGPDGPGKGPLSVVLRVEATLQVEILLPRAHHIRPRNRAPVQ